MQRCRVVIHVLRGDSEDVIGDFISINQELELFNPKVLAKPQVVVVNKIDIPDVKLRLPGLIKEIKEIAGLCRPIESLD